MAAGDQGEHGVDCAFYRRDAAGLTPTLVCLCGFVALGDSWEEAGAELDEHLEETEA